MLKTFCGFLFLGALIVGCTCDIHCFLEKQTQKIPLDISSIAADFNFCRDIKKDFEDIRADVKNCSVTKISVDKLEAFTDQICLENGTLRESLQRHEECFGIQSGKALECLGQVGIQVKFEDQYKPFKLIRLVCKKIDDIYSCLNLKFRTLCGEEAGKLTQNFTSALSSYTTGLCEELNNASSLNQVVYMNIFLGLLCVLLMWHKD